MSSRQETELRTELTRLEQQVQTLQGQLETVKRAGIRLLVVSGGWSPAFEAVCDTVASIGGGRRLVIPSPHHFPQQVSDEFNLKLADFMQASDAR